MFKKLLLSVMLTALFGALTAQSLRFEFDGVPYENGQIVICDNTPSQWGEITMEMQLHNTTSNPIPVVLKKEELQMVEGSSNYFCWGQCYTAGVSVSDPWEMQGEEVSGQGLLSFHQQIDPTYTGEEMVAGTSVVRYSAYPARDTLDVVTIEIWFAYEAETVVEQRFELGKAYPNPASNLVSFSVKGQQQGDINVSVYNLLGQEVKSQVSRGSHRIDIAVDDLQPGIYFCNFVANGNVLKTEKFVVKR